jgi:hypothetical protein
MAELEHDLLNVFLRDHVAVAVAGVELARRARGGAEGTEFEPAMPGVVAGFEADLEALTAACTALGVRRDRLKEGGAWLGEKVGRLKLNGRVTSPSPLSRVTELGGLEAVARMLAAAFRGLDKTVGRQRLGGVDAAARAADAEWRAGELGAMRDRAIARRCGPAAA